MLTTVLKSLWLMSKARIQAICIYWQNGHVPLLNLSLPTLTITNKPTCLCLESRLRIGGKKGFLHEDLLSPVCQPASKVFVNNQKNLTNIFPEAVKDLLLLAGSQPTYQMSTIFGKYFFASPCCKKQCVSNNALIWTFWKSVYLHSWWSWWHMGNTDRSR